VISEYGSREVLTYVVFGQVNKQIAFELAPWKNV